MKKQYILAALALIGLGVVTTMAFTLNDGGAVAVESEVYTISDNGATGSISRVIARPVGDLDKVRIRFSLDSQSVTYNMTIDLVGSGLNLDGASITSSDGDAGTHVLSLGTNTIIYTNIASSNFFWIEIDDTTAYTGSATVWEDIDSLIITLSDYS